MQIERLFQMVFFLMRVNTTTAKELASHFSVSTRTIYRDLDILSASGIPVHTTRGKGGGIGLLQEFTLHSAMLSDEEKNDIIQGLQTLHVARYPEAETLQNKLGGLFRGVKTNNWIEVDFSSWGESGNGKIKFQMLQKAVLEKRVIGFSYIDANLVASKRVVEPLRMIFREKAWYVSAYCRDRKAHRLFRVSRIREPYITEERFERLAEAYPMEDPDYTTSYETYEFTLKFCSKAAVRVFDTFSDDTISLLDDNSFLVREHFPVNEWVLSFLLSFGDWVEVLQPECVRKLLQKKAEHVVQIYTA